MEKYTLFNGCDEWIVDFIDLKAFEESLLMSILFQNRILIHESYFFNSNLLAQHISSSRGGLSLFELAAQRGLIIPAVRDYKAKNLREAFITLDEANKNSEFNLVIEEIAPFKNQIIASVDKGLSDRNIKPFYWPEPTDDSKTLGIQYLNILRRFFQTEIPPHFNDKSMERKQILTRVWEEKAWRFEVIEAAVEATKRNGNKGLQRMELLRLFCREIGIPKNLKTIRISEIHKYINNQETKMRALTFIKWLAQCHHLAQSVIFETTLNFPVYNYNNDFLLDSLFINKLDGNRASVKNKDSIEIKALLPPMEVLIKINPVELIAIRDDIGIGYISALTAWENNPTEETKSEVEQSIKSYCFNICKRYNAELLPIRIACERNVEEMSIKNVLKEGTNTLKDFAPPGVKHFFQITKFIKVTYSYINKRKKYSLTEKDIQLDIKNPELL